MTKDCTTCEACEEILGRLNAKLIAIGDTRLYNIRFELGRKVDYDLYKLLLFYKKVLTDICNEDECDCYYTIPLKYSGTSNTCVVPGLGEKEFFTEEIDLSFEPGDMIRLSGGDCYSMEGLVVSYSGTRLVVNVTKKSGTSENCCWAISKPRSINSTCGCTGDCTDSCPNSAVAPINHCVCGCCPADNPVCTTEPFSSTKYSMYNTKVVTKENILERIKILLA